MAWSSSLESRPFIRATNVPLIRIGAEGDPAKRCPPPHGSIDFATAGAEMPMFAAAAGVDTIGFRCMYPKIAAGSGLKSLHGDSRFEALIAKAAQPPRQRGTDHWTDHEIPLRRALQRSFIPGY